MPTNTPRVGIAYPNLTDPPNANTAYANMLGPIDAAMIDREPTSATLSVALQGQMGYANDKDALFVRDGNSAVRQMSQTQFIVKPADTTRASTTTLTADPDLTVSLRANSLYIVEGCFLVSGQATTPQIRLRFGTLTSMQQKNGWQSPSSAYDQAVAANRTSNMAGADANSYILDSAVVVPSTAGNALSIFLDAIWITGSTAGSVALNWAQGVLSASSISVRKNSWLRVTRVL